MKDLDEPRVRGDAERMAQPLIEDGEGRDPLREHDNPRGPRRAVEAQGPELGDEAVELGGATLASLDQGAYLAQRLAVMGEDCGVRMRLAPGQLLIQPAHPLADGIQACLR